MAEAVKIKEGGVDRSQNQIEKLKTNMQGGGVCYWVPETERKTESKSIDKNGTYTAEDEGLYGYSVLNVNVPSSSGISGKDDPGGNDYNVNVDDDGYLTETKIPTYIKIITPPNKTSYDDGETIDLTGIVVKAYDAEGNEMLTLGAADVTNSPQNADKSKASEAGSATSSLIGDDVVNFSLSPIIAYYENDRQDVLEGETYGLIYNSNRILVGAEPTENHIYEIWKKDGPHMNERILGAGDFTHDGKTAYYCGETLAFPAIEYSVPVNTGSNHSAAAIAWTVLYGTVHHSGMQNITVTWYRTGDMQPLTDTFEIEVKSVETGSAHGNEGGFEGGGSEHGF